MSDRVFKEYFENFDPSALPAIENDNPYPERKTCGRDHEARGLPPELLTMMNIRIGITTSVSTIYPDKVVEERIVITGIFYDGFAYQHILEG